MTVCLMLGFRGTMEHPADLDGATKALRATVAARGKKWKRVAPLFAFVRAGSELAVGVLLRKAPQSFDVPSYGFHGSRLARTHPVVSTSLRSEAVDDYAEAVDGLLPAFDAIEGTLSPLGIRLEGRPLGSAAGGHRALLVSVDGAPGVLMHGGPSDASVSGLLEAWTIDYDGEPSRFVGLPLATVDADRRITPLPALSPHEQSVQDGEQRRVLSGAGVAAPGLLLIAPAVSTEERAVPTSSTTASMTPSVAHPTAFSLRSFAEVQASFAALQPGEALRSQAVDGLNALAFDDLAAWPDGGVNDAIALTPEAPEPEQLTDAGTFLRRFPLHGTIGTWNAAAEGRIASTKSWAVLELTFTQEQDSEGAAFGATLALAQTTDGWVAISWGGHGAEGLRRVLGFDPFASSKTKWTKVSAFYGEGTS